MIGRAPSSASFRSISQTSRFRFSASASADCCSTRRSTSALQRYFMAHGYPDPAGAMHRAIIAVGNTIRAQATIMGYAQAFALIGVVLVAAVFAVALLRKGAAAGGAAH